MMTMMMATMRAFIKYFYSDILKLINQLIFICIYRKYLSVYVEVFINIKFYVRVYLESGKNMQCENLYNKNVDFILVIHVIGYYLVKLGVDFFLLELCILFIKKKRKFCKLFTYISIVIYVEK